MTYTIRFSQLASDDLTEVLGWYKEQDVKGLHKRFIEAMSAVLRRLEKYPTSNPIVHDEVRQLYSKNSLTKFFTPLITPSLRCLSLLSFIKNATLKFGKDVPKYPLSISTKT